MFWNLAKRRTNPTIDWFCNRRINKLICFGLLPQQPPTIVAPNLIDDCIISKKQTFPNFHDGFRAQYLVENAIKSHMYNGKWIKLRR